jgi:hypothetical protein
VGLKPQEATVLKPYSRKACGPRNIALGVYHLSFRNNYYIAMCKQDGYY